MSDGGSINPEHDTVVCPECHRTVRRTLTIEVPGSDRRRCRGMLRASCDRIAIGRAAFTGRVERNGRGDIPSPNPDSESPT